MYRVLTTATVLLILVLVGCSDNAVDNAPSGDPIQTELSVSYVGVETLEDVLNCVDQLTQENVLTLTAAERLQMLQDFAKFKQANSVVLATAAYYSAYTSHMEPGNNDYDLWLEYKWNAGTRQSYVMETPMWLLYWAIQRCYGGRITNWTWMEGSFQRVTAIVGNCIHTPFSDSFIRSNLRVRTF